MISTNDGREPSDSLLGQAEPVGGNQELDDQALIAALRAREPEAARLLYHRIEPPVDRAIFRVLGERSFDFEDLVQASLERIVTTLLKGSFAAECRLTTWAAAIATHVALDALRARARARRRWAPSDQLDQSRSTQPEACLEARSVIRRVQGVLVRMRPEQAKALFYHDVMGMSLQEIAELEAASESAIQSRLVRGRKDFERRYALLGSGGYHR